MKKLTLASAALLAAAPLAMAGTAVAATATPSSSASASSSASGSTSNVTPFAFELSESTVAAGGNIGLGVSGCDAGSATAASAVFDTVNLPSTGTTGEYVGAATVDSDAKVGAQYTVTFTCGSSSGTTTLTIASGSSASSSATSTATSTATTSAAPSGAVKAGDGGSLGDNRTEVAIGAGLAAAAVVGGIALTRRQRGSH